MVSFIKVLIKNPFFLWINFIFIFICTLIENYGKHLRIGNMIFLKNANFGKWNTVYDFAKLVNVSIEDYTYIGPRSQITNATIGKFCSIGPDVTIGLGKHPANTFVSSHPAFFSIERQAGFTFVNQTLYKEVSNCHIGNDVWIGAKVIIMDGLNIGNGAIIGAGAIVTKDVPSYAIVVGVPAKVAKYRFSNSDITLIEKMKWWEKDFEWIKENHHLFLNIENMRHHLENSIQ